MAVEKKFPSSPIDILYKSDLLLQKLGGGLLHEQDRKKVEATREMVHEEFRSFAMARGELSLFSFLPNIFFFYFTIIKYHIKIIVLYKLIYFLCIINYL